MTKLQIGTIFKAGRSLKIIGQDTARELIKGKSISLPILIIDQYPKPVSRGKQPSPNTEILGPDEQIQGLGSTRQALSSHLKQNGLDIRGKFFIVSHIDEYGVTDIPRHISDRRLGINVQARECSSSGRLKTNPITLLFYYNAEKPEVGVSRPDVVTSRPVIFGPLTSG